MAGSIENVRFGLESLYKHLRLRLQIQITKYEVKQRLKSKWQRSDSTASAK
jgi:hypothetical protein